MACKDCCWWTDPGEDDYFAHPIDEDTYEPKLLPFEIRVCKCPLVVFFEYPPASCGAALLDGSGYKAQLFTGPDFACVNEKRNRTSEDERIAALLRRPIWELQLSVRATNVLRNMDVQTIGQLVCRTRYDLLRQRNCGRKTAEEIEGLLTSCGLWLGMEVDYWTGGADETNSGSD